MNVPANVFVVEKCHAYEACYVWAVFATYEEAEMACQPVVPGSGESWSISKYELGLPQTFPECWESDEKTGAFTHHLAVGAK